MKHRLSASTIVQNAQLRTEDTAYFFERGSPQTNVYTVRAHTRIISENPGWETVIHKYTLVYKAAYEQVNNERTDFGRDY
jgi:hypothetical protein